jgi:hypothetical protein
VQLFLVLLREFQPSAAIYERHSLRHQTYFVPFSPVRLQIKEPDGTIRSAGDETYFDGSIEHDIPITGLSGMKETQYKILWIICLSVY